MERAQALDQSGIVSAGHHYFFQLLACLRFDREAVRIRQKHLAVPQDNGEAVIQIVRDAGGHCVQRTHAFLLDDLLLCVAQSGDSLLQIRRLQFGRTPVEQTLETFTVKLATFIQIARGE